MSTHLLKQLARAAVVAGLGVAALAGPVGAAEAGVPAETGAQAGLKITYIKCYETQDWGEDEVVITVQRPGGFERTVWGPRRMNENSSIEKYALGIDVRVGDVIRLYDYDGGSTMQKLGGRTVRNGAYWYRFDLAGALYRIRVRTA